ncbi:MAG: twin-arginine translocase TatA/TatE family subunit [Flammeovirgaceae bacterium]|nr:twin-arginine translocase TatA/TatE family subunit [Flammeovirgaceae bacterium]
MSTVFVFIGSIGGWEWLIIGLFILIFFGAGKIPEFARGLGKGIREFKDAMKDVKKEVDAPEKEVNKLEDGK